MKKITSSNYQDIVGELGKFNKFAAQDDFKDYVNSILVPSLNNHWKYDEFISHGLRFVAILFAVVIIGIPTVVLAAESSQPGDLLFPVKEAVKDVTIEITFHPQVVVDSSDQIDELANAPSSDSPSVTSPSSQENVSDSSSIQSNQEGPTSEVSTQGEIVLNKEETSEVVTEPALPNAQIQANVHIQNGATPEPQPSAAPASSSEQTTVESKTLELNVSVKGEEVVKLGL